MKRTLSLLLICLSVITLQSNAQTKTPGKIKGTDQVLLSNGWKLSPAGRSLPLGDLPLNMELSPSGKMLAVTNNGQSVQSVQLFDPKSEKLLDEQVIGKSWYGLAFSSDESKLYAAGGNDNVILVYNIRQQKLSLPDTIRLGKAWPKGKICPTGLAVNKANTLLYAVTKEDNSLYTINPATGSIISKIVLGAEAYDCLLSPDEGKLYVSLWGGDKVAVYNTSTKKITGTIATQSHPNELLLNKKGTLLYVANANDNSVSVINTATAKVIETISAALYPTKLTGATTNGLALSGNEKTLYVANADNNCLAVFDVTKAGNSLSQGFIPVGWYPTNIKTIGNKIMVSNGKGFISMANPRGPQPVLKTDNSGYQKGAINSREQYIGGLFKGTLSFIDNPKPELLKTYTRQVYANTPFKYNPDEGKRFSTPTIAPFESVIPLSQGDETPIKYVFYIMKENRTYDQVLGDMPQGNGDTSLCIFGKKVTPNLHAIANEFVLLDNFYVDAEVSADGHNWTMGAYATDFTEKTWPTSYGNRGGEYDFEGTRKVAYPKDGYIWDYCKRAGLTYRSYGEFGSYGQTKYPALKGHMAPSPPFDLNITDQHRVDVWMRDFDSLLAINQVPRFTNIDLPNDHTSGQHKGAISPIGAVADNDLAVGRFIEHLSQSPIWKECAVFIVEDDAQNGPDHVDAHRSPSFVISPYVKRNAVVHQMYSTSSILRTIELILGLPPMSQYDAAAMPMFECFTDKPDLTPYKVKAPQVDLNQRNVADNESSRRSAKFMLAKEDAAPDLDLNEVIWKYVKGEAAIMPAPKRSAFVILEKKKKDADDD